MLRKGPIIFLLAAVVLAGIAAWGANQWIRIQADRAAASRVSTAPVVVAAGELEPGQALEGKDLAVINWPSGSLPAGHFAKPAQITGRVVKVGVTKGEVMLPAKLAQEGLAGGLSAVVPDGYRAMTVRVDEVVGVGGFVQPGDRVDVLVTMSRAPFTNDPVARLILQDLPVLTVGEKFHEEAEGSRTKRRKVTVVTLQVKPDQGERLALVSSEAKIILALRNQGDHEDHSGDGVRFSALAPSPPPPPPAKPAVEKNAGPRVEVIKVASRRLLSLVPGEDEEPPKRDGAPRPPAPEMDFPTPRAPAGNVPAPPGR
jgi:pilus assembly protein CpaB